MFLKFENRNKGFLQLSTLYYLVNNLLVPVRNSIVYSPLLLNFSVTVPINGSNYPHPPRVYDIFYKAFFFGWYLGFLCSYSFMEDPFHHKLPLRVEKNQVICSKCFIKKRNFFCMQVTKWFLFPYPCHSSCLQGGEEWISR